MRTGKHSWLNFVAILAMLVSLLSFSAASVAETFDMVITDGRVIDPETGLDAVRNIGIKDGAIVAISEFALKGAKTINAKGLVVAPGWIDLHAHGQEIGALRMQAMQGVTTALELESGLLPIGDWYASEAKKPHPINYGASAAWTFARIQATTGKKAEANLAWFQSMFANHDWQNSIATPKQQTEIIALLEQAIKEGAIGIGVNAGYAPGNGQKEYFAVAQLAARYNVPTFTHVRYASVPEPRSSFEAIKELIGNAALAGAHMHLCHINSTSMRDIDSTLPLVLDAQKDGFRVSVGAYPYGAAGTTVGAEMFRGDGWQARMGGTKYSDFELNGKRLDEKTFKDLQANSPGTIITWHFLDTAKAEDLAKLDASVANLNVAIESDAMPWEVAGKTYEGDAWPLPVGAFAHPRSNGTFAKVLRVWVRERGVLSLSDAVRKMSLMPAQILEESVPQMKKKGRIQVGMDADIVVFDLATVADKSTFTKPNQPAVGVNYVMVDGVLVVENGKLNTRAAPGKPIRRPLL
ncbi:MAG TPA: amidohydrolase family protein [Burkholderiales bacterium]|nr:amidohydrolase family protein [Burkholderiales bacterium]